jgi:hypothetical protein
MEEKEASILIKIFRDLDWPRHLLQPVVAEQPTAQLQHWTRLVEDGFEGFSFVGNAVQKWWWLLGDWSSLWCLSMIYVVV